MLSLRGGVTTLVEVINTRPLTEVPPPRSLLGLDKPRTGVLKPRPLSEVLAPRPLPSTDPRPFPGVGGPRLDPGDVDLPRLVGVEEPPRPRPGDPRPPRPHPGDDRPLIPTITSLHAVSSR